MKTTHSIQPFGLRLFNLNTPLLSLILGIAIESIHLILSYYVLGIRYRCFVFMDSLASLKIYPVFVCLDWQRKHSGGSDIL